jgi:hypothetical protein
VTGYIDVPRFTRMLLHEGHPDAVYDQWRGLWLESDAAFGKRILEALAKDGKDKEARI